MRFDGLTFDPDSGELRKGERIVKLHPQPAQVLAILVGRAGKTVSREEIRQELWGDDTFVNYDLGINSCIRQIRTALGDDAVAPRYVQTIPRKGYRFVAEFDLGADAELESERSRARAPVMLATAALLLALLLAVWFYLPQQENDLPAPTKEISIAVLLFENLSGDGSLDWLRTGLTDMLVTDLARLSTVGVVSTNRLLRILSSADALDATVMSEEIVQEVAEETRADRIILGSFMKAGDNIRINVRVQDARTGEILTTVTAAGAGDSGIFSMVDELSQRLRASLALPSPPGNEHLLPFGDYSTSSLEAYRYYIEGHLLLRRSKSAEALLLYRKAVEEDPKWARAVEHVAMMYNNMGLEQEAEDYARQAFELAQRLNPKGRYHVEAYYYALREETYQQAIEKFRKHIEHTHEIGAHHIVARRLFLLERVEEAIDHWEILTDAQFYLWMTYTQLARAYDQQGRFKEAFELIESFIARFPDRSEAHAGLGEHWIRAGKLEAAIDAFEKAEAMEPARGVTYFGRFQVSLLREDWQEAEAVMKPLTSRRSPTRKWHGLRRLALVSLYRGDARKALEFLHQAASAYEHPRSRSAAARTQAVPVLLALGEAEPALELARTAQREGEGNYPEWEGLFYEASALAAAGRLQAAQERAAKLKDRTRSLPTQKETRRHHHLLGELALTRGDPHGAIVELEKARSMLLPRGFTVWDAPQHVPIWYSLASAYFEAGRIEEACQWFERISESESEHLWWPIPYVRSFYFLGRIHESLGDTAAATDYYRRFYEFWKLGDLDRARIDEARSKLEPGASAERNLDLITPIPAVN